MQGLRLTVDFLLHPLNVMAILSLLALISLWRRKNQAFRRLTTITLMLFVATATAPLPDLLVSLLERRHPVLPELAPMDTERPVYIIVLGSGHTADPALPALGQLSATALQRLTEGIRLQRALPGSLLITSGYQGRSTHSQADIMRQAAMTLGVDGASVMTQDSPSTTAEEAKFYAGTYGRSSHLVLVTSATHMPRAMYLFQQEGLQPIAAPTGHLIKRDPGQSRSLWFSTHNLDKCHKALHEYVGLLWARL